MAYVSLVPEYIQRCLRRVGTLSGILVGFVWFIIAVVANFSESVTINITLAILVFVVMESGYGVFREERAIRSGREQQVRLIARPGRYAVNLPRKGEPPLQPTEVSIDATIHFEIWADVDVDTASLVLNVVSARRRRPWYRLDFMHPRSERRLGIRIEGEDTPVYRKQIRLADPQPFQDHATFRWRGKRETVDLGGAYWFELALQTGRPSGIWRAIADASLDERGATTPL